MLMENFYVVWVLGRENTSVCVGRYGDKKLSVVFLGMAVSKNKEYGTQNKECRISRCLCTAGCSATSNTCNTFGCKVNMYIIT